MGRGRYMKAFASEDSDILIPNRNKPNIVTPKRVWDDNDSESNYAWEQTPEPKHPKTHELKGITYRTKNPE